MRFMSALTKLVVGMGKVGDYLLSRKLSGAFVASLAFACGASLAYALKPAPTVQPAAAAATTHTVAAAPPCEKVAPSPAAEWDFSPADYEARFVLAEWKNEHAGASLPADGVDSTQRLLESKVVLLPAGRSLVGADATLYMLGADRRVVWKHVVTQWIIDFAYVPATGRVYLTAGDNNLFILDAATGRVLRNESRNGRAGFGAVLPYGDDACLVMDEFSGYREGYAGGEPTQDGVTAWRGTRMLWRRDVPPDAELQVVGSKIYAVTTTKDRILVKEIRPPRAGR